jgi:4-coumarate--CoA ligase
LKLGVALAIDPSADMAALQGYLNNAQATSDAITSDGWFKTGDMAIVDDEGFYTIVDRRKELIKYKGFQGTSELNFLALSFYEVSLID